jgi:hypothetical protein
VGDDVVHPIFIVWNNPLASNVLRRTILAGWILALAVKEICCNWFASLQLDLRGITGVCALVLVA